VNGERGRERGIAREEEERKFRIRKTLPLAIWQCAPSRRHLTPRRYCFVYVPTVPCLQVPVFLSHTIFRLVLCCARGAPPQVSAKRKLTDLEGRYAADATELVEFIMPVSGKLPRGFELALSNRTVNALKP
jgi:hypothetical protein